MDKLGNGLMVNKGVTVQGRQATQGRRVLKAAVALTLALALGAGGGVAVGQATAPRPVAHHHEIVRLLPNPLACNRAPSHGDQFV